MFGFCWWAIRAGEGAGWPGFRVEDGSGLAAPYGRGSNALIEIGAQVETCPIMHSSVGRVAPGQGWPLPVVAVRTECALIEIGAQVETCPITH